MRKPIRRAAVIGAGVMGSGIAAQIANAGIPVVLLDIVPKGAASRNAIAEGAVARLLKSDPAAFMHPRNARLVTTGNLEDDLAAPQPVHVAERLLRVCKRAPQRLDGHSVIGSQRPQHMRFDQVGERKQGGLP